MKKILGAKNFVQLDDNVSFQILRTNPALTTNVKLMYDGENMFLESYDANSLLTTTFYKHKRVYPNGLFNMDLKNFWANTIDDSMYHIHHKMSDTSICTNPDNMYENMYWCGVEPVISKHYEDEYGCIAPLYLKSKLPSHFVIFKVDENKKVEPHRFTPVATKDFENELTFDKSGSTGNSSLVMSNGFISGDIEVDEDAITDDVNEILGFDVHSIMTLSSTTGSENESKSNEKVFSEIFKVWLSDCANKKGIDFDKLAKGEELVSDAYLGRVNVLSSNVKDYTKLKFTKIFKNDMKIKKKISQKEKFLHVIRGRFCNVIRMAIKLSKNEDITANELTPNSFLDPNNVIIDESIKNAYKTKYKGKPYETDIIKSLKNFIQNAVLTLTDIYILKNKMFKKDLDINGPIAHYAYHCFVNGLSLSDRVAYYNKEVKKIHRWKLKKYGGTFDIIKEVESTIKYYSTKPHINLAKNNLTLPYDSICGKLEGVYISDVADVSIVSDSDWITDIFYNAAEKSISFRTKSNEFNAKKRNANLTIDAISYNGLTASLKFKVTQEGDTRKKQNVLPEPDESEEPKPSLVVINKTLTIGADVEFVEMYGVIVENCDSFDIDGSCEWITNIEYNKSSSSIRFSFNKNETYDNRTSTVKLSVPDTNIEETITITQLGKEQKEDDIYITIDSNNNFQLVGDSLNNILKKSTILKVFDLSEKSTLGQYIRNYINQERFEFDKPLYVNNGDCNLIYYGISRSTGELVYRVENFKKEFVDNDTTITHMDDYYTMGYYRNQLYYPYIMNIEFLFSDETDNYKFCRYYGMYCNATDLYEVEYANKEDVTNFEDYEPMVVDSDIQVKTLTESPEDRPDGDCRRIVDIQKVGNLNNVYFSDGDGIYYVKDRLNGLYELEKKKHILYSHMYSNTGECYKMADILINRVFGDEYGFPKVGYSDILGNSVSEAFFNYLNPTDVFGVVDDNLMFGIDEDQHTTVYCERYTDDEGYYASFGFKVNELFDTDGKKIKAPMEGKNFTISILNNLYDDEKGKIDTSLVFRAIFTAKTDIIHNIHDKLFWRGEDKPDKPYDDNYDSEMYPDFGSGLNEPLLYKIVDYGKSGKLMVRVNISNDEMLDLNIMPLNIELTTSDTLTFDTTHGGELYPDRVEAVSLKKMNNGRYSTAQKYSVKFPKEASKGVFDSQSITLTAIGEPIKINTKLLFKEALEEAIGVIPTNYVRINTETAAIEHLILYIPNELDLPEDEDEGGEGAYDVVDDSFDYQLQGDNYKNLFITDLMEPQTYHRTSCCPIYYSNNGTTTDIARAICNAINSYEYFEQELIATCQTGENSYDDTVVIRYRKKDSKHNGIKPEDVRIEIQFDGTFIYRDIITIPTTRFCKMDKVMEFEEDGKWSYVNPKGYCDFRYAFRCGAEDSSCLFLVNTKDVKEIANDGGRERFIRTSLKNVYAKILGIVPYLDKDGYVHPDKCIMMTDDNGKYITTTEFNRIELYEHYYPKIGMLNFLPVRDFDYDTLYSIYGEDWGLSDEVENASKMTKYLTNKSSYVLCFPDDNGNVDPENPNPIRFDFTVLKLDYAIDNFLTIHTVNSNGEDKYEPIEEYAGKIIYAKYDTKFQSSTSNNALVIEYNGVEVVIDNENDAKSHPGNEFAVMPSGLYKFSVENKIGYLKRLKAKYVKISNEDDAKIENYENGLFTYRFADGYSNVVDSEYSYYMEYYLDTLSTISKTSPYISKWVYANEGKDSCENPYRLNVSKIFGTDNFSSNLYYNSGNMNMYTHSLPYYVMPKSMINDMGNIEKINYPFNVNFYQYIDYGIYGKDYAVDGVKNYIERWKEKLANCDINTFNELFVDTDVDKRHMKKYSVVGGGNHKKDANTMFRGVKFNIIEVEKKVNKDNTVEYVERKTGKYNGYKFTFVYIPIFIESDNFISKIHFVKNDRCGFICGMMFINVLGTNITKESNNNSSKPYFNLSYIYNILNGDFKNYHDVSILKKISIVNNKNTYDFLGAIPASKHSQSFLFDKYKDKSSQQADNFGYLTAYDEYDNGEFKDMWGIYSEDSDSSDSNRGSDSDSLYPRYDYLTLGELKLSDVCNYKVVDNVIISFKTDGIELTSLSLIEFFKRMFRHKDEFEKNGGLGCYVCVSGYRLKEDEVWSFNQLTFDGSVLRFPTLFSLMNLKPSEIENLTIKFIFFNIRRDSNSSISNIEILKSIVNELSMEYNQSKISDFFNIYSSHYIKEYINTNKNVEYVCEGYKSDPSNYDFKIYVEEPVQIQTYDIFNGTINLIDKSVDIDMKSSKNIITLNRYDGNFEPLFRDVIIYNDVPTCHNRFMFSNSTFDETYEDSVGKFGIIKNVYNHIFNMNKEISENATNPLSDDFALEYGDFNIFSNIGGYYIDDKLHCIKDEKCMFGTKLMGTPMTIDINKIKHTDVYNEYGANSTCEMMYNEIGGNTIEFYVYLRNRVMRYFDNIGELYKTLSYVKDAYEISNNDENKNQYKEDIFREFKKEYISKNIIDLYELDTITLWVRSEKVNERDENIENNYTSYMEYSEDTLIKKGFSKVNTFKVEPIGGDSFNRKVTYALKKGYKEDFGFTFKIRKI